jgi:hypothetical protein
LFCIPDSVIIDLPFHPRILVKLPVRADMENKQKETDTDNGGLIYDSDG